MSQTWRTGGRVGAESKAKAGEAGEEWGSRRGTSAFESRETREAGIYGPGRWREARSLPVLRERDGVGEGEGQAACGTPPCEPGSSSVTIA